MSPHGFPDLLLSLFEQLVEQLRVKVVDWQMHPSHAKVLSNQQLGQRILVIEFDPRRCTGFGVGGGSGPRRTENHAFIETTQPNTGTQLSDSFFA